MDSTEIQQVIKHTAEELEEVTKILKDDPSFLSIQKTYPRVLNVFSVFQNLVDMRKKLTDAETALNLSTEL